MRTAREHTPTRMHHARDFVFSPTPMVISAAISGASHYQTSPDEIFAGSNRSLATRAANAAGGMKFRARTMVSGSFLPFSRNTGRTRQASMVSAQETNTMKKSEIDTLRSHPDIGIARLFHLEAERKRGTDANQGPDQNGRTGKADAFADYDAEKRASRRDEVRARDFLHA